jgi:uncharacterized protein (DUF2062 family)/precorrin-6B methylase 2
MMRLLSQARLRRLFYDLRLEGEGRAREAAALGVGLFIGCIPVYGFHLLLCWVSGRVLRLNRLKMYLAANISNPVFSPFLLFAELQTGAWLRRRDVHGLTLTAIRHTSPWTFGADLLLGGVAVGVGLGMTVAVATWITGGRRRDDPALERIWRRASDPYLAAGITAWEFARGKLHGDPVYRALLGSGLPRMGGTLVDLGCGSGLALSALRASAALQTGGAAAAAITFDRMIGVEIRARAAAIARRVLEPDAEIVEGDIREVRLPACGTVLLLDVLHMIATDEQERLLDRIIAALQPGGVLVIREADASAGWRFLAVRAGNRLKCLVTGHWTQRFAFRSRAGWVALLRARGLRVETQPANSGTPFANLLVVGTRTDVGVERRL